MRSVRIVAQRVSVVMACRDYYATTRRWNSKWTAIGRLKYKVAMKRRVPLGAAVCFMPFSRRYSRFVDFSHVKRRTKQWHRRGKFFVHDSFSYKRERKRDDIESENSSSMDFPYIKSKR